MIQALGKKKNSIAITHLKKGKFNITINNIPFNLISPDYIKYKILEPVYLSGVKSTLNFSLNTFVKGGGFISRIYAIRQSIAKVLLKYYNNHLEKSNKNELRLLFMHFDKHLLFRDTRVKQPKIYGGRGSKARFQKSYR